ncbi:MAG: hypothetical protein ACOYBY_09095 [Dermatophilaceae bacterium]
MELKQEIPGSKGANKELARDLASLAIDSGTLIVGLGEVPDALPVLHPVELDGLPERIEQVARTTPDPPLPVLTTVIRSSADPSHGYVLVHVPASGMAPHMVDGVYYGRGDKTKHRLSDADVVRLHQQRTVPIEFANQVLNAYVARDPTPEGERRQAHLFIVAAPLTARPEMVVDLVSGTGWQGRLLALVDAGGYPTGTGLERGKRAFTPDLPDAESSARRSDGAALTYRLTPERTVVPAERNGEDVLELELSDEGAVRMMTTRLSDRRPDGAEVLFENTPVVLVRRVLGIAGAVAEAAGYHGSWAIALEANGIARLSPHLGGDSFYHGTRSVGQDQNVYRATGIASYAELTQIPGALTSRLLGRFLRSLALDESPLLRPLLTDPDPPS